MNTTTRTFPGRIRTCGLTTVVLLFLGTSSAWCDNWHQAAGPNHDFVVQGYAPPYFSVSANKNILWRTALPNTGQGTVILSGEHAFVMSHAPVKQDTQTGSLCVGQAFDAITGKQRWRREIPAVREIDLSSLFSDNTAASPATDGTHICFVNVGGSIHTFDFDGNPIWSYAWTPFGRHHSRQHEPLIDDGHLVVVQTPHQDLPLDLLDKEKARSLEGGSRYWTHLQSFDVKTGKRLWVAEAGTSIHSTSLLGHLANGQAAILTGRGGGHNPLEKPYGLSLVNAKNGKSIWDQAIPKYPTFQNACWNERVACQFSATEHLVLDIETGDIRQRQSLTKQVAVCAHTSEGYTRKVNQDLHDYIRSYKKPMTYQTNLLIGNYHYFMAHHAKMIGRVHIESGAVEYLQVPAQVVRIPGQEDVLRWDTTLPNDLRNADGFLVTQDKRNAGSGWGHVSAPPPIVVGNNIYFPTMVGTVYVIRWDAKVLDQRALLSVSDLGQAGKTWSLSGLSYANGRLYARTLKELICIAVAP
ncbi:MAG: PQQ-binding-like beta-propeller repeat protein [Planctomycetota bacterium]|nr:PQQ-binding-like beta-propeller repeat protein [Planctomycetota bacterium]